MIQKYTIGRNPDNMIVYQDPMISGSHAEIIVNDSMGYPQYTLVDHSTNGTLVNGQVLKNGSCFVVYNDVILFAGKVLFDWERLNDMPTSVERQKQTTFSGALKSFFQKYADFSGRATRAEYWFIVLWSFIFGMGFSILAGIAAAIDPEVVLAIVGLLYLIFLFALFIPSLSLLVRRIHDTGKDGLWILMLLVPFANIVFLFIWTLSPSEMRPNKWGKVRM